MVDAFRKAKEQREAEEYRKFLPIDYDAPLPAPPEDAKWTDSIGARVSAKHVILDRIELQLLTSM